MIGPALAIVLSLAAAGPALAWRVELLDEPRDVVALDRHGGLHAQTKDTRWRIDFAAGKLRVTHAGRNPATERQADALHDTRVVSAPALGGIVYLALPTKRYTHGVLGDAIEAEALFLLRSDGSKEIVRAGDDAVFEDLVPRLHDVNADGIPEIVIVKSYLSRGAALAVIGRNKAGVLSVLAETPSIGTPNRWLNPAGFADFTGTGAREIALVRMPHALGRLELWRWESGKLVLVASESDTSNHAIGSRVLELSAVADFDGDGVADLAIPSFDRRSIRLLRFRGGISEIARIALPGRAGKGLSLIDVAGQAGIVVVLDNGRLAIVRK